MNVKQFNELVLLPSLKEMHTDVSNEDVAKRLVLETIWHESQELTCLKQINGPALGVCQMEYPTFNWITREVLPKHPQIFTKFTQISPFYPYLKFEELSWNLKLNVVMCRLRYWVNPKPLPKNTLTDRAQYWFDVYNISGVEDRKKQYIVAAQKLDKLLL